MKFLDKQYFETPFYGVLRLIALLNKEGYPVNVKRVRRLMKLVNWRTIYRETLTTICNKADYKYPYLWRNLKIERRNQV
jgi:putative transposase